MLVCAEEFASILDSVTNSVSGKPVDLERRWWSGHTDRRQIELLMNGLMFTAAERMPTKLPQAALAQLLRSAVDLLHRGKWHLIDGHDIDSLSEDVARLTKQTVEVETLLVEARVKQGVKLARVGGSDPAYCDAAYDSDVNMVDDDPKQDVELMFEDSVSRLKKSCANATGNDTIEQLKLASSSLPCRTTTTVTPHVLNVEREGALTPFPPMATKAEQFMIIANCLHAPLTHSEVTAMVSQTVSPACDTCALATY